MTSYQSKSAGSVLEIHQHTKNRLASRYTKLSEAAEQDRSIREGDLLERKLIMFFHSFLPSRLGTCVVLFNN